MSECKTATPYLCEEWLEYERLHGGRFCLHGSIEDIAEQVRDLTTRLTNSHRSEDVKLEVFDTMADAVPVRIYRPQHVHANAPICIFSHGGGFCTGDLDSEDGFCRWVANALPCTVISVDYRLGPEHKLPVMIDDVVEAYTWICKPENVLVTRSTKVFAMGGSAGGALSLSLANHIAGMQSKGDMALRRLDGVVALAPITLHPDFVPEIYRDEYQSYQENAQNVPIMGADAMMTYFQAVNAKPNDSSIFTALSEHHKYFPPCYIATCGADPLRDDGIVMAKILRSNRINVRFKNYPGLPHIFWIFQDLPTTRQFGGDLLEAIRAILC